MDKTLNQMITILFLAKKSAKRFVFDCKIETQSTIKTVNRRLQGLLNVDDRRLGVYLTKN